jgi:hypothetical protein
MEATLNTAEQKEVSKAEGRTAFAQRLAAALGNGAEWEYRGELAEDPTCKGKCACGHEGLRFLFTIHHAPTPGRSLVVGSSCVETFPGVNAAMVAAMVADLEALRAKAREAAKRAREASAGAEVAAMVAKWSGLCWDCDRAAAAWLAANPGAWRGSMPYPIYRRLGCEARVRNGDQSALHPFAANPAAKWRTLKSAAGQKRALGILIARAEAALADIRRCN